MLRVYPSTPLRSFKLSGTATTQTNSTTTACVQPLRGETSLSSSTSGSMKITHRKMTEQRLSTEFEKIYPSLRTYASKAISALKSPVDVDMTLAECYIHVHKVKEQINDSSTLEAYSKNWIKRNLQWSHSPLHRTFRSSPVLDSPIEQESADLTPLLELYEQAVSTFLPTLSSYDRRLWSIYVEKQKTKGTEIAQHLEMSRSTGFQVLRECKALMLRFREHISTLF